MANTIVHQKTIQIPIKKNVYLSVAFGINLVDNKGLLSFIV